MEMQVAERSVDGGSGVVAYRRPHFHPNQPFSALRLHARAPWIIPVAGGLFVVLAVLARIDALPWDRPVTEWFVDQRTPRLDDVARSITRLGADMTVWPVVALCALCAWPRCRPLALAIVVIAASRPLIVDVAKHLVDRERPPASLAISHPGGLSFPSGHPFAVAASFGFIPLVLALYTSRRWIWWASVVAVWSLVLTVGLSRVYLGVHYLTDVVASLLLAIPFVAGSEVVITHLHRRSAHSRHACEADAHAPAEPSSSADSVDGSAPREDSYAKTKRRVPMNRWIMLLSGLTLAVLAIAGCVDAARNDHSELAVLFGILAVGVVALAVAEGRNSGVVLRRDLATWVDRTSAVTGETADELTSRAVSRLRAGFSPGEQGR